MRIRWDEAKRQLVLNNRGIDFAQLDELLSWPYVEDQRNDDPEQFRVIGFVGGRLITFIVEYRQDMLDEYIGWSPPGIPPNKSKNIWPRNTVIP